MSRLKIFRSNKDREFCKLPTKSDKVKDQILGPNFSHWDRLVRDFGKTGTKMLSEFSLRPARVLLDQIILSQVLPGFPQLYNTGILAQWLRVIATGAW